MPTARELLEQADALMRRNRKRGKDKHGGPPTLTDALGVDRAGTLAPTIILPDAAPADVDPLVPDARAQADPIVLDTLSDLPVLTDVVDVWPAPASAYSTVTRDRRTRSTSSLISSSRESAGRTLARGLIFGRLRGDLSRIQACALPRKGWRAL